MRYESNVKLTGWLANSIPEVEGTAYLEAGDNAFTQRYLYDVSVKDPGSDKSHRLTAGADGDIFYLIDWDKKTAYEDLDPAVLGDSGRVAKSVMMIEFVHKTPFRDEITGEGS